VAEAALLRAIEFDSSLIQARRELIYLYGMQLRRRDLSEQFEALSRFIPLSYDEAFLWCLSRGLDWDAREQYDTLRRFLTADPSDRRSRLALAECLARMGRPAEADRELSQLDQSDPDVRAARARLALDAGRRDAAERLLSLGPAGHAGIARLRGKLALLARDVPGALAYYRVAERSAPPDRETLRGLAQALTMGGAAAEAEPYLRLAKAHDAVAALIPRASTKDGRNDPSLPSRLGAACEAAGLYPEAKAWYTLAVKKNPLDQAAQAALYRLSRPT
jgi:tetratricopeptide (TPR) repeat protein